MFKLTLLLVLIIQTSQHCKLLSNTVNNELFSSAQKDVVFVRVLHLLHDSVVHTVQLVSGMLNCFIWRKRRFLTNFSLK